MSCCGSLGAELIGFNARTGQPVQAAAGLGSYSDLKPNFYQTYSPDSSQHAGSRGWSAAPVPGWGNNPLLAGPPRIAVGQETVPQPRSFFKHEIVPAVITGVIVAVATGVTMHQLQKAGLKTA